MKIDGINLINDSSVKEARIENGDNLPTTNSGDEGRMFWLKRSYGDFIAGLYVSDGVKWNYTNDNEGLTAQFRTVFANMDITVQPNTVVLADTTNDKFQITLPANPSAGDFVNVVDVAGKFKDEEVTIVRNGAPIRGKSENVKIKVNNATVFLTYTGTSEGWQYSVAK